MYVQIIIFINTTSIYTNITNNYKVLTGNNIKIIKSNN